MAEPDNNLKEIEALKVELLAAHQTINKLQMRSDDAKAEKDKLSTKIHEFERQAQKKEEDLDDVISLLKSDVATLTKKKIGLEAELSQKGIELAEHQMASKAKIERLLSDWDADRTAANERYRSLEEKYNLIVEFEEQKADMEQRLATLEAQVKKEIADRLRAVADKEREKVELVDKLKREMEQKIHDTKTTMLALKKEQLDAASRLAVVQNHQLTTELEYQNRQVEKIVAKLTKLEEDNVNLKRDVQIHKEVETEMAKKTTKAQSVIKKLGDRVKELETEVEERRAGDEKNNVNQNVEVQGKKDEIIKFLQQSLESTEKKLAKLQNDYGILLRDFDNLERRLTEEREKYADAATLVREALENIVEEGKSINGSENANMLAIDLEEIKGKPIAELDNMQKQLLLNVILEQIKKHLNERNLTNEFYPVMKGRSQSYGVMVVDKKAYQLPNIHEKSLASKINKSKFDHSPRSVKSRLLKGELREWGVSMPEVSPIGLKEKIKYKI